MEDTWYTKEYFEMLNKTFKSDENIEFHPCSGCGSIAFKVYAYNEWHTMQCKSCQEKDMIRYKLEANMDNPKFVEYINEEMDRWINGKK